MFQKVGVFFSFFTLTVPCLLRVSVCRALHAVSCWQRLWYLCDLRSVLLAPEMFSACVIGGHAVLAHEDEKHAFCVSVVLLVVSGCFLNFCWGVGVGKSGEMLNLYSRPKKGRT